jgi:hypothetical protein
MKNIGRAKQKLDWCVFVQQSVVAVAWQIHCTERAHVICLRPKGWLKLIKPKVSINDSSVLLHFLPVGMSRIHLTDSLIVLCLIVPNRVS